MRLATAAAAAVGAGLLVRSVNRQIDRVDALQKASDKLGTTTEFLSRLQFTASQTSGLGDDQTLKGIEKMSRRISEAAQGGGEAVNVLKELGLSARQLAAQGPEKTFFDIARAMDSITQEHDRIRISTKLFDDEQAGLHTTLRLTNTELKNQFDRADQLSRTVSSFDASQMVQAKNAIGEMNAAFDSFSRQFATSLGPAITQMLIELTSVLESLPGASGSANGDINRDITIGDAGAALFRTGAAFASNLADGFTSGLGEQGPGQSINPFDHLNDVQEERFKRDNEASDRMAAIQNQRRRAREEAEQRVAEQDKAAAALAAKERGEAMRQSLFGALDKGLQGAKDAVKAGSAKIADLAKQGLTVLDSIEVQGPTELERDTQGPLSSLSAGSSEAFRFANQTTAVRSVQVDMERRRTVAAERQTTLLEVLADAAQSKGDPELMPGVI